MENVKEKILLFVQSIGLSKAEIARQLGISKSNFVGEAMTSDLNVSMVIKFCQLYPQVSAEWLLRGTGDMLNKQADTIIIHNDASGDSVRTGNINGDHNIVGSHNGAAPNTGTNTMQDDYKRLLVEKDKQIADLRKDKENLMQLLTNLTAKR